MSWFEDRIRSAALFALGAAFPLLGIVILAGTGGFLVALPGPLPAWARISAAGLGLFLLGNGLWGLALSLKTFSRPPGRRLKPGEAPLLEARLEEARAAWKGPRAPILLLAPDAWSVELTAVPTAGMLGWSRFHWNIGIYPLLALSLREFEALAGWEVVFWSDYQGWLNLQVKRLAVYWYRLHLHLLALRRKRSWPVRACAALFTGLLRAYSRWLVVALQPFLAREFVRTDRTIAERHGAPTLVRALCRLATLQPIVARRVFAQWDSCIEKGRPLPEDLYQHLGKVLGREPEAEGILDLALDGLQQEAPPLLRLRLDFLGTQGQVPLPPDRPAFHALLEETEVMEEVHGIWRGRMEADAAETGRRKQDERRRFREMSMRLLGRFPDHPDSTEFLELAFDHASWDQFDVLLGMFREAHPGSVPGAFLSIRRALQRGREHTAVLEARELLHRNPMLAPDCHEILAHHLRRRGDLLNADREWDRALRAAAMVEAAKRERKEACLADELEAHGCSEAERLAIQRACLLDLRIKRAWLVRKKVEYHAERPVLLLVVHWEGPWLSLSEDRRLAFEQELREACPFPARATGFVRVETGLSLARYGLKLRRLNGLILCR